MMFGGLIGFILGFLLTYLLFYVFIKLGLYEEQNGGGDTGVVLLGGLLIGLPMGTYIAYRRVHV